MKENKTKGFTNYINQDFDIVKDYKNASKELTPLEAFKKITKFIPTDLSKMWENANGDIQTKEIVIVEQALTDYTKQTEMLVELVAKYRNSTGNYAKLWISDVIKDINTILEGGK
jgi:hypothetical protein